MTTGSSRVFHSDKYPNKTLIPVTIGDDSQVEEPHVWFQKNQSKPRYIPFHWDGSTPEDQKNNLKLARELVVSGILSGNPKKDLILAYCQYIMKAEMVDISSTEWKSFNQQIIDAGGSISALELLSPTGTSNLVSLEGSADGFVGTGVDLYLMIALASMWRYGRVNPNASAEYRTRLQDNFRKVLDSTLPTDLSAADKESLVRLRDFNDYVNTGGNWVSDAQMDILMAACDMFLNKFRSHPYSLVRLGSITARYKDCSALLSINSCLKMHGFGRIDDLIPWCFSTVFTDELFQLCNPNEELSNTDSYFPYHMDMKLCRKTPFSSSANPHLFALIHVVGSMKNVQRSLNAVMPQNIAIDIVMINALLMGYAFRNSPDLTFSHFDKNEEKTAKLLEDIKRKKQAEEQERGANVSEMLSVPSSNHPADWYRYYLAHGKKLSKEIVDYAKSLTFGNALREGSIGKHTKLYFEQSLDSTVNDQ